MWQVIGIGAGVGLALGFAGQRGRNWAVRVLSALAFVLLEVVALIWGSAEGKGSPGAVLFDTALVAFVLVAGVLSLVWVVDLLRGKLLWMKTGNKRN